MENSTLVLAALHQDWKWWRLSPRTTINSHKYWRKSLAEWLIQLCRRGIPVAKTNLLDSVQCIMKSDGRVNPFPGGRPGRGWSDAFLRRNPLVVERNAESISRGWGALTEGCIRGWFSDAQKFFSENKCEYILNEATKQYNADETGFHMDPKTGRILACSNIIPVSITVTGVPITVSICSANNYRNTKKVPITVAFATFHFKNSFKIICTKYDFKNGMVIIS